MTDKDDKGINQRQNSYSQEDLKQNHKYTQ